jgi:hypothetical protein
VEETAPSTCNELNGLPLAEFTPPQPPGEQARAGGQRELAELILKLRKRNLVAWLANELVRERGDEGKVPRVRRRQEV